MAKQEAKVRLTANQEEFVVNLISGMTQREAYKKAFSCVGQKDSTIDAKASKLFAMPKIRQRYDELQELLKTRQDIKAIMSAEERMEWLTKVVNGEIKEEFSITETNPETGEKTEFIIRKPSKLDVKLKALDTLNKMSGEYVTKLQGDVNIQPKLEDLL